MGESGDWHLCCYAIVALGTNEMYVCTVYESISRSQDANAAADEHKHTFSVSQQINKAFGSNQLNN